MEPAVCGHFLQFRQFLIRRLAQALSRLRAYELGLGRLHEMGNINSKRKYWSEWQEGPLVSQII